MVNFSVRGDVGATYSRTQVKEALWNAPSSSILLMHMNHPEGETAQGVIAAIPELKKRGFSLGLMITEGNIHADQSAQRRMKISFIDGFLFVTLFG